MKKKFYISLVSLVLVLVLASLPVMALETFVYTTGGTEGRAQVEICWICNKQQKMAYAYTNGFSKAVNASVLVTLTYIQQYGGPLLAESKSGSGRAYANASVTTQFIPVEGNFNFFASSAEYGTLSTARSQSFPQ